MNKERNNSITIKELKNQNLIDLRLKFTSSKSLKISQEVEAMKNQEKIKRKTDKA
jgi:hypothetical protein